jgi:hypothetical protein
MLGFDLIFKVLADAFVLARGEGVPVYGAASRSSARSVRNPIAGVGGSGLVTSGQATINSTLADPTTIDSSLADPTISGNIVGGRESNKVIVRPVGDGVSCVRGSRGGADGLSSSDRHRHDPEFDPTLP